MSSAACAPAPDVLSTPAQRPPTLVWALRRLRCATAPARTGALLRLFGRLQQVREQRTQLRVLVRRARLFTPDVADKVATLARSNPDGALEVFVSAFQRDHFELDEAVCDQGFDVWADVTAESLPLLMRGTDRCNGIDPLGSRPGYALQWALIQDVFDGDERAQVIAEVAETFGEALAGRLEAAEPPAHQLLRHRLARSPYYGMLAFSQLGPGRRPKSPAFPPRPSRRRARHSLDPPRRSPRGPASTRSRRLPGPHAGARALARARPSRTRPIAGRRRHGPAGRRRLEPFGDPAVRRMRVPTRRT